MRNVWSIQTVLIQWDAFRWTKCTIRAKNLSSPTDRTNKGPFYSRVILLLHSHRISINLVILSPNILRVIKSRWMRWVGHVARMWERRSVYRISVGKSEGKRQLGRPRHRWEDNINMDFQEVVGRDMDWMELVQDRDGWREHVNVVMNLRNPWNAGNFLTSCEQVSFWRRTLLSAVRSEWVLVKWILWGGGPLSSYWTGPTQALKKAEGP